MSHLSKREIGDVIHPVPGDETHANRSVATEETVGVTVDQGDPNEKRWFMCRVMAMNSLMHCIAPHGLRRSV